MKVSGLLESSALYKKFMEEREEILKQNGSKVKKLVKILVLKKLC